MGARWRDPEPSEPLWPGPRVKICSSSCLSWLHPLRSWSLRQTRRGSVASCAPVRVLRTRLHAPEPICLDRSTNLESTLSILDWRACDFASHVTLVDGRL